MPAILLLFLKGFVSKAISFIGWCIEHWKIVLPIIIIVGTLIYVHHLRNEVAERDAQIAQDVENIKGWSEKFTQLKDAYDAAVADCKRVIDEQNAKVETIKKQAETFKKKAATAAKESDRIRLQYERRIQDILNEPKPENCDDSIKYLIDHSKGLGTWEKDDAQ